ncbi:MAG: hypothetical protein IJ244_08550, partial [Bacteroidaceae bacterium]|nr:hypothetical protein [Bacteroidaceae bacterium]
PQLSKARIKSGRSLLDKATKGRAQSYVLISLSYHTHISLVLTHYLLEAAVWTESDAKLQIFVDFDAEFGRNMLQEIVNSQFFCWICQKVVGKFGNFENSSYLCTVRRNVLATPLSAGSKALQILLHLNKRLHHVWCGFFYCSYFLRNCR